MEQISLSAEHASAVIPGKPDGRARLQALAGAQVHQCAVRRQRAFEQDLDAAAAFLEGENPRGNDARIVENQQIPPDPAGTESP